MTAKQMRLAFVVLLAIVFLAGQLHFCADTTSGAFATHICPLCATAGTAILAPALSMAMIPVLQRLEVAAVAFEISLDVSRTISPRAPPSLA